MGMGKVYGTITIECKFYVYCACKTPILARGTHSDGNFTLDGTLPSFFLIVPLSSVPILLPTVTRLHTITVAVEETPTEQETDKC